MSRILITGATGFVGRALLSVLRPRHEIVATSRRGGSPEASSGIACHPVGEIGPEPAWSTALRGGDTVVHLAAHVHQSDATADPAAFHRINSAGTRRLAEAARQ